MKLPDKTCNLQDSVSFVKDGATILIGGFGVPGSPFNLIEELVRHGAKDLTLVKNDANEKGMGIDHLIENGQVRKLIVTHLGLNARVIEMMNKGEIEVEFCAQGILAERIHAGGAGLVAFLTDIGMDCELAEGKERVALDGNTYLVEKALRADFAFVHVKQADPFGNLRFSATSRSFGAIMAMAADCVIAETEILEPLGGILPDDVHVPGPFVDHVVCP